MKETTKRTKIHTKIIDKYLEYNENENKEQKKVMNQKQYIENFTRTNKQNNKKAPPPTSHPLK